MKPKILKTNDEYEKALGRVEALMDAKPGTRAEEELELWALLVEQYEREHHPVEPPDPINAGDLTRFIPNKSKVSEVLNRKRTLSLSMIRALHVGLGIPAEILVQESGQVPGKQVKKRRSPRRAAMADA